MNTVLMLQLLVGSLAAAVLAVVALYRFPAIGFWITSAIALSVWEFPAPISLATVGGLSIQAVDLITVVFLGAGLLNWRRLWANLGNTLILWGLLGFTLIFSIARGVAEFGTGSAVNEARDFLSLLGCLLWSLSLDWNSRQIQRAFAGTVLLTGWLLSLLGVYHAIRYGVGSATDFIDAAGLEQTGRILVAVQALIVGLCSLVILSLWSVTRSKFQLASGIVFGAVMIVSQHRSVWAAILVAGLVAYVHMSGPARANVMRAAVVVAIAAGMYLSRGLSSETIHSISKSVHNLNTYSARTSSWQTLVEQTVRSGPFTVIFGDPFGAGYLRQEPNGLMVAFEPHNFYVTLFLRTGLLGLALYVIILLEVLRRLTRARGTTMALGMFCALCVFGWAYGPIWLVHFLFACGLLHRGWTRLGAPHEFSEPARETQDVVGRTAHLQRQRV